MLGTGLAAAAIIAGSVGVLAWSNRKWQRRKQHQRLTAQRETFFRRREWLEAKFLQIAGSRGTPRGLEWVDCDFETPVSFARDRHTGELTALVAVSIRFRAIEGGGMEDVEAVANEKYASAVFRHRDAEWMTEGRAIFNLNPRQAIEYYQQDLESVDEPSPL